MKHPFFNAANYPWNYEPEAVNLHQALYTAIDDWKDIANLYKQYTTELPLTPNQSADKAWAEALDHLSVQGLLRNFCYDRLADKTYRNNTTLRDALQAVIEAQGSAWPGEDEPEQREAGKQDVLVIKPPRWTPEHVAVVKPTWWTPERVAVVVVLGLSLGLFLGWAIGHWLRGMTPTPPLATLPVAEVFGPYDEVGRAGLSDDELSLIRNNVSQARGSTVLIVRVGPWSADAQINVQVRPAENASNSEQVYRRSRAFFHRGDQTISSQPDWDSDAGSFTVEKVDGKVGDRLYILVVLPVTGKSEPLLANDEALKRFLCVEICR